MMKTSKIKTELYKHITKTKNLFTSDFTNYLFNDPILLYYSDFSKNWGDYINPFLVEKITGKQAVSYKRIYNVKNRRKLYGVGSILHHPGLQDSIIWGSGFIYPPKKIHGIPSKILALRGKNSAKIFENFGVTHNNVFGDPALLFPSFYNPDRELKYKVGIIPHYSELKDFEKNSKLKENKDIKVISPMVPGDKVYNIIDQLKECEIVISSSLHGLILADAYGKPSLRFNYSNKLVGGNFKFEDYYSGVGINKHETIQINKVDNMDFQEIKNKSSLKDLKYDKEELYNVLVQYVQKRDKF
ncbi:polysaccharide pyruvyl transferase family protein [Gramella sp. MT6]|uniref:polysaccharide pyruvyl transferase family protein n=1 Tax=Gramella sp. MT6 TaxID=2705471 RepID=UPI001C5E4038|nr:polysaccharide pyruvyl transferase family protein [Gramella sp. MT6]QYA26033.1 polysaccharide pyruvyl transferase family protein [Gramella sp. MT6]